ncbi:hypothetical protein BSL78_25296 [Apostichopus japonicus]|uniref:Uncharacterized protein n=1 Tax=Stichopus japonicus TaxID=307972 RepID=A0A2G8JQ67_STIJA|nr:hypothetical protein BSL78_25296 [Apostichopus japonicus]
MADLDEMRQRLDELEKELVEAKKGSSERPGVVYLLPKEKKLRSFSGVENQDVLSFIEEAKAALRLRKLEDQDASEFVIAHLEGSARQEVKHRPQSDVSDPKKLFELLQETFGERRSLSCLMRDCVTGTEGWGVCVHICVRTDEAVGQVKDLRWCSRRSRYTQGTVQRWPVRYGPAEGSQTSDEG